MKYYCTKYWSTQGIIEFEGRDTSDKRYIDAGLFNGRTVFGCFLRIGTQAFETLEEAKADVIKKARKSVKSKTEQLMKAERLMESIEVGDIVVVTLEDVMTRKGKVI